ncbi:hypothetical protein BS50DRAFT_575190 [Corynespora cassiicola Philippines]|uniref:Multicopper oxidase n=1 Tax=Corynespora cassiicola Philippines TaxID=1448308 RepID=A0A2T2NI54_CORCC|nr:hypothetical protein BS50DRAFT_575190 [Corynespora cassiicola Philippines]
MSLLKQSFVSLLALVAVPLASGRAIKHEIAPRQATPGFTCTYPEGWVKCNEEDRGCWVRDPNGKEYGINTNYEDEIPEGTLRTYSYDINEVSIQPDGFPKTAQLINGEYPGPLIEACWGDTVEVTIRNTIRNNATTIHWHGVRMLGHNEMDGVNGVTQCPISEGDSYTYRFRVTQYGHSWYHSHYSSQYTDGVAGPLLFHGPTTANWTQEWNPIIIADWYHESAYEAAHQALSRPIPPPPDTILMDGQGRFNGGGSYFNRTFEPGERYLIRLVNGGTDFHFDFSIDNHNFTVVSADFVPIEPYVTTNISVGIGQRFSIIVEANPMTPSSNGKYWIRTDYNAAAGDGCNFAFPNYPPDDFNSTRLGFISYPDATEGDPTSERHPFAPHCNDEPIVPRLKWNVTPPQNNYEQNIHTVQLDRANPSHGFARWEIADTPLWINFSDPTLLNVANTTWNPEYVVENYNYTIPEEFVYMAINNAGNGTPDRPGGFHPMHLHGHDVAVIKTGDGLFDPSNPGFNLDNPPRRDVVMLPTAGHLVIAFKPDNPGVWLLHCHIAWHAGSGLALQVLERQDIITDSNGSLEPVRQGCNRWTDWLAENPDVWNYGDQEDSGI